MIKPTPEKVVKMPGKLRGEEVAGKPVMKVVYIREENHEALRKISYEMKVSIQGVLDMLLTGAIAEYVGK